MYMKEGWGRDRLVLVGVDAEEPLDLFFFVTAVTTRVDADSRELAALAPAFEGEGGDT